MARSMGESIVKHQIRFRLHSSQVYRHSGAEIGEAINLGTSGGDKLPPRVLISLALREAAGMCESGPTASSGVLLQIARCWKIAADPDVVDPFCVKLCLCELEEQLKIDLFHDIYFRSYLCNRIHEFAMSRPNELQETFDELRAFVDNVTGDSADLQSPLLNGAIADFAQAVKAPEYHQQK